MVSTALAPIPVTFAAERLALAARIMKDGTPAQKARMRWVLTMRSEQVPPGDLAWAVFLYLAGRGAGKTRAGAEWLADMMRHRPRSRWAIVAATYQDARDTCMEGESGLLYALEGDEHTYHRSLGELVMGNGARVKLFSADEPNRLRGPQHHGAWCDELAAWRYVDTWDQLQFGLRLGTVPQVFVSTTPRPTPLVLDLVKRHGQDVVMRRGSTFDNAANLAPAALAQLRARYEGTRLGRQELFAEILEDTPGALWTQALIESQRRGVDEVPPMRRVVVGVDPAVTSGEDADWTGIVAVGLGVDGHLYVLEDRTCRVSPDAWARVVVDLYDAVEGDRVIAEVNQGGDLVETVLRTVDSALPVRKVHAARGKRVRAEPVAALYEQGRVHHVGGFDKLESELTTWTPDSPSSPDRLDALVWAITDLAVEEPKRRRQIVAVGAA